MGYRYVHEVMADPLFCRTIERLMEEVTSTLKPFPGMELTQYKQTLIERFANPKIQDQLPRLSLNGSAKLPKFILGAVRDRLSQGASVQYLGLVVAAWMRYLMGTDDRGGAIAIDDPMAEILTQKAKEGLLDPSALFSLSEIFGDDLPQSPAFVEAVRDALRSLCDRGVRETLAQFTPSF